jgi:hypothetical protein
MVRLSFALFLMTGLLASLPLGAYGQQSSQNAPSSDQWVSHQMNQPAPDFSDRSLSQERLDDLRELYERAKREAEAKAAKKASDKK